VAHLAADQVGVALVVGMDGDRGVAEHRLGAGGRHLDAAPCVPGSSAAVVRGIRERDR
jgi:hypothetical protein